MGSQGHMAASGLVIAMQIAITGRLQSCMLLQGKVLTTFRSLANGGLVGGCGFLGDFVFTIFCV